MSAKNEYRDNGAIGAILDEYEKAIRELQRTIQNISDADLAKIVDHATQDPACRSIQTILSHVVVAGYAYVIEIRKWLGEDLSYHKQEFLDSASEYNEALNKMFAYNEKLFSDYPNIPLEENDPSKKILVRWGQHYDVEQLFEHAIVHILRHRRQIERFLLILHGDA